MTRQLKPKGLVPCPDCGAPGKAMTTSKPVSRSTATVLYEVFWVECSNFGMSADRCKRITAHVATVGEAVLAWKRGYVVPAARPTASKLEVVVPKTALSKKVCAICGLASRKGGTLALRRIRGVYQSCHMRCYLTALREDPSRIRGGEASGNLPGPG